MKISRHVGKTKQQVKIYQSTNFVMLLCHFSALRLLVGWHCGRKGIWPVKNLNGEVGMVICLGYRFAYDPDDATATLSCCSLGQRAIKQVLYYVTYKQ